MNNPMRIILMGNAGAGKTTMAQSILINHPISRLSLDEIAYGETAERRPFAESEADLLNFISTHSAWIMEGVYGDLIQVALPFCTELIFLNPGLETCVAHCLARPWEPTKFKTAAEQDQMLGVLIEWVKAYYTRTDQTGYAFHRQLFETFTGPKQELTDEFKPTSVKPTSVKPT